MAQLSQGTGRYAPGEDDLLVLPTARTTPAPGVIYCHPSGGSARRLTTPDGMPELRLLEALADGGFAVIAPDLGGPSATWGNDLAVARIAEARTFLEHRHLTRPGRALLLGVSMGAVDMTSFARARRQEVAGLVAVAPVCDLEALLRLGADDLTAHIERAWDLDPGDPLPATANPRWHTAQLAGLPWLAFYAADDPLVPAESVRRFSSDVGGTAVDLGPVGHVGILDAVPAEQVVDFLRRCCD